MPEAKTKQKTREAQSSLSAPVAAKKFPLLADLFDRDGQSAIAEIFRNPQAGGDIDKELGVRVRENRGRLGTDFLTEQTRKLLGVELDPNIPLNQEGSSSLVPTGRIPPKFEEQPQPFVKEYLGQVKQFGRSLTGGAIGVVEGLSGGLEWLTKGKLGKDLAEQAREWQKSLSPADPTFLDSVASGFGSAISFFIPGMGVSFGTARLAAFSTRLASWLGTGTATALEAMTEAGITYRNVLEDTGDRTKAESAAEISFWFNVPLVIITNKYGIFSEKGRALTKGIQSALLEAPQEALQEGIAGLAEDRPVTLGQYLEAGGVGAVTGGTIGGVSGVVRGRGKTLQDVIRDIEREGTAKGKGEPSKASESQVLEQEEGVKQETGTPLSEAKRKELAEQGFTKEEIGRIERAGTITEDIPVQEQIAGEQVLEQEDRVAAESVESKRSLLSTEGILPELLEGPLTVFDEVQEAGISGIRITDELSNHLDKDTIKDLLKKKIGFMTKKPKPGFVEFDVAAETMGITTDELAEKLSNAETKKQALDRLRKLMKQRVEQEAEQQLLQPQEDIAEREAIQREEEATEDDVEFQTKEFHAGIPVNKILDLSIWKKTDVNNEVNLPEGVADTKFSDPKVENRVNDKKVKTPSLLERGKAFATHAINSFQRHFQELIPGQDGLVANILRVYESVPEISVAEANFHINNFVKKLGDEPRKIYERHIIMQDIVKDIDKRLIGKQANEPLRFGFKSIEDMKAEAVKYEKIVNVNPHIKDAVEKRTAFFRTLKQKLVDLSLLDEKVMQNDAYYHHQVLEYLGKSQAKAGSTGGDVRQKTKGFQRSRTKEASVLDYNTSYFEAEFEVVADALVRIRTAEILQRLQQFDITKQLKAQAKKMGITDWKAIIPEDYTSWQPVKGHIFYPALSINERLAQDVLDGTRELSQDDMHKIYALGGKRTQWVIPKRYAETFDNLRPFRQEGPLSNVSAQTLISWKQWVLLNPHRVIKYSLNNMAGDLDIVIAYDWNILKQAKNSYKELLDFHRGEKMSPDVKAMFDEAGLMSGQTMVEIPDVAEAGIFKLIAGQKPNLINKYWNGVKGFNAFRENLLRLAAYKHFRRMLLDGKRPVGASIAKDVESIPNINERAAKLARELIGDYGNISVSGQWIRRHMIPFYSWMEINAPRYVRMMGNLREEGRSRLGAGTVVGAGRTVSLGTRYIFFSSMMYTMVELWNRAAHQVIPGFPAPEELPEWQRRQHHIILGRREDGSIRTLRFQGALGDALDMFGAQDIVEDVREIKEGGAKIAQEKGKEVLLAPLQRGILSSRPFIKGTGEALTGVTLFPDITQPKPIRDPWEHLFRIVDLDKPYRYLTGLPTRGLKNNIEGFAFYISDPRENAYYNVKGYVYDYLKERGKVFPLVEPTQKSNALYYYKQAIRYGEPEKAQRFLDEYRQLGGTVSGLKRSIKMAHPLNGIEQKPSFLNSLTPAQQRDVKTAIDWYTEVYR